MTESSTSIGMTTPKGRGYHDVTIVK